MNTIKQNIIRDLTADKELLISPDPFSNHYKRQNFELFIEGSYGQGAEFGERNRRFILGATNKQIASFIIRQFTEFVAVDYSCSYGYAQKCIVEAMGEDLEALNAALFNDVIDFATASGTYNRS